ncbi:MAG: glycosyltransferase family 4 protein [Candidatus Magasanikbacteria bacterium]|nr:glycosyltransferase family 4 protein [Candidatus Magasanikbacteria bacterium]
MKLLLITQTVDRDDTDLGFFHTWIKKIAGQVDTLTVICLKKGDYDFPLNVNVLSLGKEEGTSRFVYLFRFYRYIFSERKHYDHVFVHMNPEYLILGGFFWRLSRKKVLLWYTHKAVNFKLRLAEKIATKIFTASKESFRLPSKKVEVLGHGIDVDLFSNISDTRKNNSVRLMCVGRISLVKDLETVILGFHKVVEKHPERALVLDIIGEPITVADQEYKKVLEELIQRLNLSDKLRFIGGKKYHEMAKEYAASDILVHTSKTGSMDKVVLEALASGLRVISSSEAYEGFDGLLERFPANNSGALFITLEKMLSADILTRNQKAVEFIESHFSLDRVLTRIVAYFDS